MMRDRCAFGVVGSPGSHGLLAGCTILPVEKAMGAGPFQELFLTLRNMLWRAELDAGDVVVAGVEAIRTRLLEVDCPLA